MQEGTEGLSAQPNTAEGYWLQKELLAVHYSKSDNCRLLSLKVIDSALVKTKVESDTGNI